MNKIIIGIAILLAGAVAVLIYFITKKTDSPSTTPPPTSPDVPTTSAPVNMYDNWVNKLVPINSNITTLDRKFRENPTRNLEDGRKWCTSVCDSIPECNTVLHAIRNTVNQDDCLAVKSLNNTLVPNDYWSTSFNKSVPTTSAPVNMYDN